MKKLTPYGFLESIVDAYRRARMPIMRHRKLSRGESRSIASEAEDRLAHFLISRHPSIERIYINQKLHRVDGNGFYKPDLVICRGGEVNLLIDLKMDLGYKRNTFRAFMRHLDRRAFRLQGRFVRIDEQDGDKRTKERQCRVAKRAKYVVVAISNRNIGQQEVDAIDIAAKKLRHAEIVFLVKGAHPNERPRTRASILEDVNSSMDRAAFRRLDELLTPRGQSVRGGRQRS